MESRTNPLFVIICITALSIVSSLNLSAQQEGGFTADRPGATTGPDVLPKGRVQWETGTAWERSSLDGPLTTTWTVNTSMLRWGFSDYAELRLQADYLHRSYEHGGAVNGFDNVTLGTKVRLFDGYNAFPAVSLLANVLIPGGDNAEFLPSHTGGQMGLLFANDLTSWCSLGYEVDLIWNGYTQPTVFWGLGLGFSVGESFTIQVEEYNHSFGGNTESWSELSFAFQLSPRVQLDLGTDINLNHPDRYHNLLLGVSWQLTSR